MIKLFVYAMREYDEKPCFDRWCRELGVELGYTTEDPTPDTLSLAQGYDAVCVLLNELDADSIRRLHQMGVKYLSTRTVGFDHIDLEAAQALHMPVVHAFYPPQGVANYTILLMLLCCRKMKLILERSLTRNFTLQGCMGSELSNLTVGILGTGQIGSTVIRHLAGFGCKILAYDPYPRDDLNELAKYVTLEELYQQADIISLHIPASKENRHIIGREALHQMREGVILVNTGRGDLIDSEALIEALDAGKVGGAGLDVLEDEAGLFFHDISAGPPLTREMALLRAHPSVIITPHTAFYTDEAVEHMVMNAVKGVVACAQGGENPFLVS